MTTFEFAIFFTPSFNVFIDYFCFTQFSGSSCDYNFDKCRDAALLTPSLLTTLDLRMLSLLSSSSSFSAILSKASLSRN